MASPGIRLPAPSGRERPRLRLTPVPFHHLWLDGTWSPASPGLDRELRLLVPELDRARGPVQRLLLGAGGWTVRPNRIVTGGRTVTVGYLAGQSPWMMTVIGADGTTFGLLVTPPPVEPPKREVRPDPR
jgi:hypothetical protein